MKKKLYIYPTYTPSRDKSGNLYIKNFHEAFKNDGQYTLINRVWYLGIASILLNLDADLFIIQWVDLIPFKRFGKMQYLFFLLAMFLIHFLPKKKIVWVLHNKHAHRGSSKLVDYGMNLLARYADCIITHSSDGVVFFDSKYTNYRGKCHYIPHPVYTSDLFETANIKWDYIIWGGISPRKQVVDFLEFARSSDCFDDKKILLCGHCSDANYKSRLTKMLWDNVTYIDRFVDDEELKGLICSSRSILFTYSTDSLLSSGALIYSLNFCKPIIGPNSGNFKDLKGIVSCYNQFEDIPSIQLMDNSNIIQLYIKDNTWRQFPEKVFRTINS